MVPSWTETLLECGISVVGRTRFCIHPENQVKDIPIVGGTKDIDWDKVFELSASVLLLDQEENPIEMAEESQLPYLSTRVTSISDVPNECRKLAKEFQNEALNALGNRWHTIANTPDLSDGLKSVDDIPGVLEWIKKPEIMSDIHNVYYIIWQNPWMYISRDTFVGSVLSKLGLGKYLPESDFRYPTFEIEDINQQSSLLLFSSEPYPFLKKKEEIARLNFNSAIVNGECFSWFGIRSLQFLESRLKISSKLL